MLCICSAVLAEDTSANEEAKAAFNEGLELFRAEKYIDAALSFRRAYKIKPNWKILYNVGQSYAASKHHGLALEAFDRYMSEGGDDVPEMRQKEVVAELARLRNIVGSLEVEAPKNSMVLVDDMERGRTPLPGALKIAAGVNHTVLIEYMGDVILSKVVRVSSGDTTVVSVSAPDGSDTVTAVVPIDLPPEILDEKEEEKSEPTAPQASTVEKEKPSPLKTVGWVLVGVGAAALAGGAVTGIMTTVKAGDLKDQCPDQNCPDEGDKELRDSVDTLALTTDILLPVGGAIAVTGAVLLIIGYRNAEKGADNAVSVAPLFAPDRGGLILTGSF
ncbi:MAG: tetratricopeptide repeat protein [Deltaproteobacteria bacterium]|nr:tetratricopeptide repeat protein [Deltaproteobacteria bacterium]